MNIPEQLEYEELGYHLANISLPLAQRDDLPVDYGNGYLTYTVSGIVVEQHTDEGGHKLANLTWWC